MSLNMEVSIYKIDYCGCVKNMIFFWSPFVDLDFSLWLGQSKAFCNRGCELTRFAAILEYVKNRIGIVSSVFTPNY